MRDQKAPLHRRENHRLLAIPEKRALLWLAKHMPDTKKNEQETKKPADISRCECSSAQVFRNCPNDFFL